MPGSKVIEIHRRRGGSTDVRYNRAEWVWIRDSDRTAVDPNRSHAPTRAHWSAMPELLTATYRLTTRFGHPSSARRWIGDHAYSGLMLTQPLLAATACTRVRPTVFTFILLLMIIGAITLFAT